MNTRNICAALTLIPNLICADFATLEEEYTPNFCIQLEGAYGDGMMSEGGVEGIELMFDEVSLKGKTALDIGSGLGGVAFYLAEKNSMKITGLEVNPWMVTEATRRIPEHLQGTVDFLLTTSNGNWPLPQDSYDLIYSKGVLTHLESKDEMFQECHRLLKDNGLFIITDWLSPVENQWGEHIGHLLEHGNLVLYAESEAGYIDTLTKQGFTVLSVRDDSSDYLRFNREIVARLQDPASNQALLPYFQAGEMEDSIDAYETIAKAIEAKELRVIRFIAQKN